jgi:hypothetical protein
MNTLGDADEASVWTDAPLDGHTTHPCWGVGIRTDALNEVMPLLRSEALALGLVVYDMQAGSVYLPDGRVLGQEVDGVVADTAQESDPVMASKKQLLDRLQDGLLSCMAGHGFNPTSHGFVKKGKELSQVFLFDIGFYGEAGSKVRLYVSFELHFKASLKKAIDKRALGVCSLVLPILFQGCALPPFVTASKTGVEFTVTRASEVRALTTALAACLDKSVFGIFSRCENLQELAAELEADRLRPERTLVSYTHGDLLVAFLTNRSVYETLIDKAIHDEASEYHRNNIVALKNALSQVDSRP